MVLVELASVVVQRGTTSTTAAARIEVVVVVFNKIPSSSRLDRDVEDGYFASVFEGTKLNKLSLSL